MRPSRRRIAAAAVAVAVTAASLTLAAPAGAVVGCADPADYGHSIPAPVGIPAAAPAAGSTVLWATIGADRQAYYDGIDVQDSTLAVSALGCLGGGAVGVPAVVLYDGAAVVFVLAPTGRIYQKTVTTSSPTGDPWTLVPGAPVGGGSPVATVAPDGALHLLVRGSDNRLRHARRPAGGSWSAWEDLGGSLTDEPALGARTGGGLLVVVRAPNGSLYQKLGTTGAWGAWSKLPAGTTSASPTIASGFAADRLDLFVTGTTGGLYQAYYRTGPQPSTFRKIDGTLPPRAGLAAVGYAGTMTVFATGTDATGVTLSAYDRWAPGLGWSGFGLTPYTCEQCLPTAAAGTVARTRIAPRKAVR